MSPNETIDSVKKVIENELNIPTIQQRLMYKGKPLAGWLFNILLKIFYIKYLLKSRHVYY